MENDSHALTAEQLALLDNNLELTIDERINQLQSAVDLIEEMRNSLESLDENRLQTPHK